MKRFLNRKFVVQIKKFQITVVYLEYNYSKTLVFALTLNTTQMKNDLESTSHGG